MVRNTVLTEDEFKCRPSNSCAALPPDVSPGSVSGSTRSGCGRFHGAAWQRFGKVEDFAYE